MSLLARNGQSGHGSPKLSCKGEDLLVVLVGHDKIPVAKVMKKKLKVADLKDQYGERAIVFLWNKNLQSFPRRLSGGILWIEGLSVIAVLLDHRHGVLSYIMVLYPCSRMGEKMVFDMRSQGCFLDLVLGVPVLPFKHTFKSRDLNPDSGEVLSLVDDYKYIKMDVKGPDIFEVHQIKVPENIKVLLQKNPLTSLKTLGLKRQLVERDQSFRGNWIPVVYVYQAHDDHMFETYKFIQRYLVEGENSFCWNPVLLAPIGELYDDFHGAPSNR